MSVFLVPPVGIIHITTKSINKEYWSTIYVYVYVYVYVYDESDGVDHADGVVEEQYNIQSLMLD